MRILFLDDDPKRGNAFLHDHPGARWVLTARDCIDALSDPWNEVWLDHDLGGEVYVDSGREDCGMEVVRWIRENRPEHLMDTRFTVHSFNAPAAMHMVGDLRGAGYNVVYQPFKLPRNPERDKVVDAICGPEIFTMEGTVLLDFKEGK